MSYYSIFSALFLGVSELALVAFCVLIDRSQIFKDHPLTSLSLFILAAVDLSSYENLSSNGILLLLDLSFLAWLIYETYSINFKN